MTPTDDIYSTFRLTAMRGQRGYVVWAERLDGIPMVAGFSCAPSFGTSPHKALSQARLEAIENIDNGQWK